MSGVRPFTTMMVESEISVLRRLHGMLEHDPVESREEFADLMAAAFEYGNLEARALSDDLGYSFSTVYRWVEGRSAPHPSLWPTIVAWVMSAIKAKIVAYDEQQAREHEGELA